MSSVSETSRSHTKDVWNIVSDGGTSVAYTAIQFYNRSPFPMLVAAAFASSSLVDGDSAVDQDGNLILTNINTVILEDTISTSEGVFFDKNSGGTIIVEQGNQFVYTVSGNGDVDVLVSGIGI